MWSARMSLSNRLILRSVCEGRFCAPTGRPLPRSIPPLMNPPASRQSKLLLLRQLAQLTPRILERGGSAINLSAGREATTC